MQFPPENDTICQSNKNQSHISPTTLPVNQASIEHKQQSIQQSQMKIPLDYPLCSSLLNDHLFQADFYGGLGSYTINTEWLV